jgi:DNA polymerase-4
MSILGCYYCVKGNLRAASVLAQEMTSYFSEVGLTASMNIINKFVAKIASDINKPNGQKT